MKEYFLIYDGTTDKTLFVSFYYRYSPKVADFIRGREPLKAIARTGLNPKVCIVEKATH